MADDIEKTRVFLPWLGEFGTELLFWAPYVKAYDGEKIVCYEIGKEPVYSFAEHTWVVARVPEPMRGTKGSAVAPAVNAAIRERLGEEMFVYEEPAVHAKPAGWFRPKSGRDYRFSCDVVLFPRFRSRAAARKNWDAGWRELAERLTSEGLKVFAAGARDMSAEMPCPAAWDYDQELDATIWAIVHSRFRLGGITGLTVLSILCGHRPWVLTTPDGRAVIEGRDGPNWGHLRRCDHLGVGWDEVRLLGDVNGIVEKIKNLRSEI